MPSCVAFGCNNRSSRPHKSAGQNKTELAAKVTFHKFPKNPERRNAWTKAVRRVGWIPNKNSVLCSVHFAEDAFDRTSLACIRIRDTAVPSVFPAFPSYLQNVKTARESTSRSVISGITPLENVNTTDIDALPSTSTTVPDYPLSSLPAVSSRRSISRTTSFSLLRRMHRSMSSTETVLLQKLKQIHLRYKKRIKRLQQSERRHVKKIASLQNALIALKNKNLISGEHIKKCTRAKCRDFKMTSN